jgi:hypothetical protein
MESLGYSRTISDPSDQDRTQDFDWECHTLGVYVRGQLPLLNGWLVPYLQVGGGLSLGFTRYQDDSQEINDRESFAGWTLGAAAGLQLMPWKHFGFFGQIDYATAPAVKNLLGDRHDGGGLSVSLGLRGAL